MARHPDETRRRLAQTASRLRSLVHPESIAPDSLTVSERTGRDGWRRRSASPTARRSSARSSVRNGRRTGFGSRRPCPRRGAARASTCSGTAAARRPCGADGEVLQGLYSGWRALRTAAPVLEPAAGGERVELAVEMACNSWAGDDPDPAPGVDPGLAARYRLGRNWSEAEGPPRAPADWARLEQCALARFDPEAWRARSGTSRPCADWRPRASAASMRTGRARCSPG